MVTDERELAVYGLIALAVSIPHASYLLGIGPGTTAALAVGSILVALGSWVLVPAGRRAVAVAAGVLAVVVGGGAAPVYAARAVRPDGTLALSVLLACAVLLVTLVALRLTTFGRSVERPA